MTDWADFQRSFSFIAREIATAVFRIRVISSGSRTYEFILIIGSTIWIESVTTVYFVMFLTAFFLDIKQLAFWAVFQIPFLLVTLVESATVGLNRISAFGRWTCKTLAIIIFIFVLSVSTVHQRSRITSVSEDVVKVAGHASAEGRSSMPAVVEIAAVSEVMKEATRSGTPSISIAVTMMSTIV